MIYDNLMEEFDRWYERSNVFPSKERALERWKSFGLQGLPDYPHEYPIKEVPGWKLRDEGQWIGENRDVFIRTCCFHWDEAEALQTEQWRLPTPEELRAMVDNTRTLPSTNLPFIAVRESVRYATSHPEICVDFGRVGVLCEVSPFHSRYVRLIAR